MHLVRPIHPSRAWVQERGRSLGQGNLFVKPRTSYLTCFLFCFNEKSVSHFETNLDLFHIESALYKFSYH